MSLLNPCPYCGRLAWCEVETFGHDNPDGSETFEVWDFVECSNPDCDAQTLSYYGDGAVEDWNAGRILYKGAVV